MGRRHPARFPHATYVIAHWGRHHLFHSDRLLLDHCIIATGEIAAEPLVRCNWLDDQKYDTVTCTYTYMAGRAYGAPAAVWWLTG